MASYLVERLKRKRSTVRSAGKGVERLERSHSAGGDAEQHNRFGSQLGSSGKVKRSLGLAAPLLSLERYGD